MLRTNTCGELTASDKSTKVTLCGWVHRRRDHGGLIFIDLRDRYGLTQLTFDSTKLKEADKLRSEWVISVTGKVAERPAEMINKKLKTGEIEIEVEKLEILSESKTPPFSIDSPHEIPDKVGGAERISQGEGKEPGEVNEEIRMKYRYCDLRKQKNMEVMIKRHEFIKFIRDYLSKLDFVEVETPILGKSTPEGARDFLVPARLQPGKFYALPQSPQQYKQLLMLSGMDRYFQVAKCFRDEDTRGDRQAEFTQLDMEMSFIERDDILDLTEDMITKVIKKVFPAKKIMFKKWPRLEYDEVMLKYGNDKPDLRFGLEIEDVTEIVKDCGFKVFADAVKNKGVVRALCATGAGNFSRAQIDELTELVRNHGAKGLAYIIVAKELRSPLLKFLKPAEVKAIIKATKAKEGDIIFFGADKKSIVCESLSQLRNELGKRLNLVDPDVIALAFVINFPLFEEEKESGHYAPSHHMFTSPRQEDAKLLDKDPGKVKSYQYDMIGNGYELGGGSIRIHDKELQEKIFDLIGFDKERKELFSHFLRAFQYGVPPHGGIAPGVDRILMVLMNKNSIRDVMAFPKTGDGRDLTMEAPSEVEEKQLKELHLKIKKD